MTGVQTCALPIFSLRSKAPIFDDAGRVVGIVSVGYLTSYLDSITLWHYNGTEAGAAVVKDVTMGSLLFAIIASMVAWALIRNLPGLLEVLVLSRLKMRQGASYAITTILNYAIIAIGAMTVFGSLGVSWDKLQWLAAALSVGLGFGLQEIFGPEFCLLPQPVHGIGIRPVLQNQSPLVDQPGIDSAGVTDGKLLT